MNGQAGSSPWTLNDPLDVADPEVYEIVRKEKKRQTNSLEMIASENFTSLAVLDCLSSCLHNKYSEGQPGARYYGGNEHIDEMELLAKDRALAAFGLSASEWGVNVQPYSGSPANFAVYTALMPPHGRLMGLDLPDGGHLTHGFYTEKKKISASSMFFESMPYKVNPATGLIDYDELSRNALLFKPRLIVAGISCYSRHLDYERFRAIADSVGALLMADMAHVAGLVAAGLAPSPFPHCDVVTTTAHKTLRGPRSGCIYFRKAHEEKINSAVFPALQGGPHNTAVAGIAVAMKHAATPEFRSYQQQVVANARCVAEELRRRSYRVVTGGTDTHLVLLDLRDRRLSGSKAERILEEVGISVNKNTVPGDKSAMNPSGIRFGTPPLTTRGFKEQEMEAIVGFVDRAFRLAIEIQAASGPKLVDWKREAAKAENAAKVAEIRKEVEALAVKFPLPGREHI